MSLVAAEIFGSHICLVADSQVTYVHFDSRRPTRAGKDPFTGGVRKLTIIRPDLCVGLAGSYRRDVVSELSQRSEASPQELASWLQDRRDMEFIVASLAPAPRLLLVAGGRTHDRTEIGQALLGPADARSAFRSGQSHGAEDDIDDDLAMLMGITYAIDHDTTHMVGGFHPRVSDGGSGFAFMGDGWVIGAEQNEVRFRRRSGGEVQFNIRARGYNDSFTTQCCPGVGDQIDCYGYFIPELDLGLLWPRGAGGPCHLRASSVETFVSKARAEHGVALDFREPPTAYGRP